MDKILIWGTGEVARELIKNCDTLDLYNIIGFVDNNSSVWNKQIGKYTIFSPDKINIEHPDIVVIATDFFYEIRNQIREYFPEYKGRIENKNYFYFEILKIRYNGCTNPEINGLIHYAEINGLDIFNYPFAKKMYDQTKWQSVYYDDSEGLWYADFKGKKLYFAKKYDTEYKAAKYYNGLLVEQDPDSPHRYLSDSFNVNDGDIVVDCGAAEGIFSLGIIDRAREVYLLEADEEWIQPLKKTFAPYINKVHIIKCFVSNYSKGRYRRLDDILGEQVDFIKMDIEGAEWDALEGAHHLIAQSSGLKMAICEYHSDFDQEIIDNRLIKYGFLITHTPGLMWFPYLVRQNYVSLSFHKGVVRAKKL